MGVRRPLVLLFTDIGNSTALAAGMEPEDYAALLGQVRAGLQLALDRHQGTLVRIDGDGALCVFGFPDALEDAGRRAVETALEFHAYIRTFARKSGIDSLAVHTGVHAGLVLVEEGDLVRGLIEVLGDATNVAARLCDFASPDRLIVSENALGVDAHFFTIAEKLSMALPGHNRNLAVLALDGSSGASRRFAATIAGDRPHMVVRELELAAVLQWIDAGPEPVMLVHGEPGIGKSRLLHHLEQAVVGENRWNVATGFCEAYLVARPLQPIVHICDALAPESLVVDSDTGLTERLAARVARALSDGPLLLIIDDWQWADDATVRFVDTLLAWETTGLRVLLASRNHSARLDVGHRCRIQPVGSFSTAQAQTLIASLLPFADPQLVARIDAAAGGSPLMIEELCHDPVAVLRDGLPQSSSFRLASLVGDRLSRTAPEMAAAIAQCAVIGTTMPLWLFQAVNGWSADDSRFTDLLGIDFLVRDAAGGRLRFKHGLVRDAVYAQLSPTERRTRHRRVADALLAHALTHGEEDVLEQLAYHMERCGDPFALGYVIRAGDMAMHLGSLDRALAHYRAAIGLALPRGAAPDETMLVKLGNRYGSAALPDPHREHQRPLQQLADAALAHGLTAALGRTRYWQASLHYATGFPNEALQSIDWDDGSGQSRSCPQLPDLSQALVGQALVLRGEHMAGRHHLDQAIERCAGSAGNSQRQSLAYMLGMRAKLCGDQGHFASASADFASADRILSDDRPPMYGSITAQRAAVALWQGDFDACRAAISITLDHGNRVGSRYSAMIARALLAYVDFLDRPDPRLLARMEASIGWFDETGSRYSLALSLGWCADAARQLEDTRRAENHARHCLSLSRSGLRWGSGLAARVLASISPTQGEAQRALRRGYALARQMQSVRDYAETLTVHADLHDASGAVDDAGRLRMQSQQLWGWMRSTAYVSSPITSPAGIA